MSTAALAPRGPNHLPAVEDAIDAIDALDRVILPVRKGVVPSPAPPVRIFLGTEPSQQRPERVFVWSIEKVRDPARVYEVVIMSGIAGFDRRGWTTGFTNYRFLVPHLAGGSGRAIYNDEDQIYLRDPAELFDLDLDDHGFLAVSDSDTSVMLMDSTKMAEVWPAAAVHTERKRALLDRARARAGTFGRLAPEWNARDEEYDAERSRLLHYTTLHTQPWRPFPARFVYSANPVGHLWFDLETEANADGYQLFGRDRPSRAFPMRTLAPTHVHAVDADVKRLVERSGACSLLEIALDDDRQATHDGSRWGCNDVVRVALGRVIETEPSGQMADGVLCLGGLDDLPSADMPWVVDELFRHARRFVFASIECKPSVRRRGEPPTGTDGTPVGWQSLFEQAAARHPDVHWEISLRGDPTYPGDAPSFRSGGRFLGDDPPRIWVLSDGRPGHDTQSEGLAEELGWPWERKALELGRLAELPNALLGVSLIGLRGGAERLGAPWPDVVIACGRRLGPVARWIRRCARGRVRIVQLGRKGTEPIDQFDLSVAPEYAGLFPHPQRIVTRAPLTRVRRDALEQAALHWKSLLDSAPRPHIALLVGGDSQRHVFSPEVATRLGREVMEMARARGGSVVATTSRRTRPESADALAEALQGARHVHLWRADQAPDENPYLAYLALADELIVTGESASMLSEACATGKPVSIYALPARRRSVKHWITDTFVRAVQAAANARRLNRRGTTRPQKRLEHLAAILLARGIVRPATDIDGLHHSLIRSGAACLFGDTPAPSVVRDEAADVAARVRTLLGFAD
jgi:mitochondrial fission protein ELM1